MTTKTGSPTTDFDASLSEVTVGGDRLKLWRVADLERHVDRDALLRACDPPEPPYWAYLWSGARALAAAVPHRAGRVIELGCGLGLPALVAARRGARVVATDRERVPLAFVRASAAANGLDELEVAVLDFQRPGVRASFDTILLAEVLYDRSAFAPLVQVIDDLLAPGGTVLLTDGERIDTADFYARLRTHGFRSMSSHVVIDDGECRERVRLVRISRP